MSWEPNNQDDLDRQIRAMQAVSEMLINITSVLFDKSSTYTSLIMVGGYAGIFSIWGFVNQDLSSGARAWVALLLAFSLAVFVLFEVYKMFYGAILTLTLSNFAKSDQSPKEMADIIQSLNVKKKRSASTPIQVTIWLVALFLTVSPALGAFGLLGYNMLAVIAGWPLWPANVAPGG